MEEICHYIDPKLYEPIHFTPYVSSTSLYRNMGYIGPEMGWEAPFRDPKYLLSLWAESVSGLKTILPAGPV